MRATNIIINWEKKWLLDSTFVTHITYPDEDKQYIIVDNKWLPMPHALFSRKFSWSWNNIAFITELNKAPKEYFQVLMAKEPSKFTSVSLKNVVETWWETWDYGDLDVVIYTLVYNAYLSNVYYIDSTFLDQSNDSLEWDIPNDYRFTEYQEAFFKKHNHWWIVNGVFNSPVNLYIPSFMIPVSPQRWPVSRINDEEIFIS